MNFQSSSHQSNVAPTNRHCSGYEMNMSRSISCRMPCLNLPKNMGTVLQTSSQCCSSAYCKIPYVIFIVGKKYAQCGRHSCRRYCLKMTKVTTIHWSLCRMKKIKASHRGRMLRWNNRNYSLSLKQSLPNFRRVNEKPSSCVIGKTWTQQKLPQPWGALREA